MNEQHAKEGPVLKNYMEDIVRRNIDSQKGLRRDACWCARCENDVFAMVLNRMPPKYVVTDKGHIYTKLQEMETQLNVDVTREVHSAIEHVAANKRHA